MRTMGAGEFKAKCLAVLDDVLRTGEPLTVTKRGKPVAKVSLPDEIGPPKESPDAIFGCLRGMARIVDDADLVTSEFTDEEWERMAEEKWNRIERENAQ